MKKLLTVAWCALVFALVFAGTYQTAIYKEQGGARMVVDSGGSLDVASGGEIDIESGGALKIGGTAISATAAQFNFISGVTAGTSAASKAVVLSATSKIDAIDITALKLGGTSVTATAAELNILDDVTADKDDINFLDGATAGTQVASKAVIADANVNTGVSKVTELHIGATGSEVQVTSTPAELNYNDITTAGTAEASKALVADGSIGIAGIATLGATDVDAGASGTAGTVDVFPSTATSGKLSLACADNGGDFTVTVTNAAHGQASSVTIPDSGLATSYLLQSTAAITVAEANVLDDAVAGTQVASKAVVADSNVNTGISKVTELHIGASGSEVQVSATPAQINTLARRPAVKAFGYVVFAGRASDTETITIEGRVYEFDTGAAITGDVTIDISGSSDVDGDITAAALAITNDGSAVVSAVADTTNDILWIYASTAGVAGNALTLADAVTNATASGGTLSDGADAAMGAIVAYRHTVTAQEATDGFLRLDTSLTSIQNLQITYEDAGVNAIADITVAITDGVVLLTEGSAPAWAASDVINMLVIGTE